MVGADGNLPLPWLEEPVAQALSTQRAHALLIHGPRGVGQWELTLTLAQAWLCEAANSAAQRKPCGSCASCKLVQSHTHPDLLVLLPEALREPLGWSSQDDEGGSDDKAGKRKPSKDIRVDEIRQAISFAQTTSARGHGKVVVIHPAERMNGVSANALLKTLEEPPGDARLLLSCSAPDALLPTIRSRCQAVSLALPDPAVALPWLADREVSQPEVMLAATGGQPQDVLEWVGDGIDAKLWLGLPRQLARGEVGALASWPLPRVVDMLQKLCHDTMRVAVGSAPRYFPASSLPGALALDALTPWSRELDRLARQAEHPWNAGLLVESLTLRACEALTHRPG